VSSGLEYIASENALGMAEVLRRASLEWVFRVGVSLDADAVRPPPLEANDPEDGEDPVAS
jgi:hypothetical protein